MTWLRQTVALVFSMAACSDVEAPICTDLPCDAGLAVAVPAAATVPYTVTLQVPNAAPISAQCVTAGCTTGVVIAGFLPEVVTITVQWQGGSSTRQFTPTYHDVFPNGPTCESCKQGTVAF